MSRNPSSPGSYQRSVFINCPFDAAYQSIFDAIVFTVLACGFSPRCALEFDDSGTIRLSKIVDLIEACGLGINDISRTEADRVSKLPRFNMPLELGLFLGASRYGIARQRQKTCLILDKELYRLQKFISDIAGQDIKSHGNDPASAIKPIRDFLSIAAGMTLPGPRAIIANYEAFNHTLPAMLKSYKLEMGEVTYADRNRLIVAWVKTANAAPEWNG